MNRDLVRASKFLSFVLRHDPGSIGLALDANGWADVGELIERAQGHGQQLDRPTIELVVRTSDKQRFALSGDGQRIRANQGHSIDVDLALEAAAPPAQLFHGTAATNVPSIAASGLHSASRQHVHLSPDAHTAHKVGARHGKPVVLRIDAGRMHGDGHVFYRSENGVWLTDRVPAVYIEFPSANA
ncbi:MAG: RNA 2'-phosphotransferase [Hyphomicrobiaceae bacterium]